MNIGERRTQYETRGFRRESAAVNVLIEAALQALFAQFPDRFVFIGGASLVLFYGSQRHSADLDLWLNPTERPNQQEIIAVVQSPLKEVAEALGLPGLTVEAAAPLGEVSKFSVKSAGNPLFTIDLTSIGAVLKSEVVSFPLAVDNAVSIPVPSRNLALLFKAEAFLTRRRVKARDAFDIKLLIDSGAQLSETLKIHLTDGPAADQLEDPIYIADRISAVNTSICRPELQPFLPEDVYRELATRDFKPLRDALTVLFSEWL
jgi:hypothetical protein